MSTRLRQGPSEAAPRGTWRQPLTKPSKRAADDEEGTYQVDLVVSLFAVFMLLLTVSSHSLGSDARLVGHTRYSPTDSERRPFQLQTFSPVYAYRTFWTAKAGELVEIDFEAVAQRYAQAGKLAWEETIEGADVTIASEPGQPDGFQLELRLFAPEVPDWLARRRVKLADADAAYAALVAAPASAHIFIWPEQHAALVPVLARLRAVGKPFSVTLQEAGKNAVRIQRSAADFQRNSILRGQ